MPTSSSDHLNYSQVLLSSLTKSQTDPFWLCIDYRGLYNISGHVDFDGQNGHNNHVSLDAHNRSYTPRQAEKGLILPGNLFIGWHQPSPGDVLPHPQQCAQQRESLSRGLTQLQISFWLKVLSGEDLLPEVCHLQPFCTDIQVFIECVQIHLSSCATYFDA